MSHPMMPIAMHDERTEQLFVRDLKTWLSEAVEPHQRTLAERAGRRHSGDYGAVRRELMDKDVFRSWFGVRSAAQEMMWDVVGRSIDRQHDDLTERARIAAPLGSVKLDPDFKPPRYIAALDIHMMPGGYQHDRGGDDIRQGALMDRGGAVYMLGRNGGLMNDMRGHTTVQHLFERYPEARPSQILELGCGIGASTVAVAGYFPEAEVHGLDVGGAMLRYAHARAAHLNTPIHFVQGDAEQAPFKDETFDLVFSCVLLHETSNAAVRRIMAECHRLLRPGGVMIHCEVPAAADTSAVWQRVQGDFEALYNNEPFWRGVQQLDFAALATAEGFGEVTVGYQLATANAQPAAHGFSPESSGPFRSWLMISARK